ncbi:hypothetical protein A4X13_0g7955, partial [Tilletia indica]
SRSPSTT